MAIREYTPQQLKIYLETAEPAPLLLDVRETWEYELCCIQGSRHIPMGQIPDEVNNLDADRETIVICHHGGRSLRVAAFLEGMGFNNVVNLAGGVAAWACEVEPDLAQY